MKKGTDWSREETIIAFYVYCIVPFSKSSKKNSVIIHYANILGRTPSALHMKISNIGRLDPELKEKNITGLTHGSKIEEDVWNEFESDRESLVLEAEKIIERMSKKTLEDAYLNVYEKKYTGEEKERLVRMRVNQNFFRSSILSAYYNTCAITGMKINELLIASHIKPWAKDINNRLNPHNGICLNVIHDKAFDQGYITIDKHYRIIIAREIRKYCENSFVNDVFYKYDRQTILIPNKFKPSLEFLEYHNDMIFKGG
jgi:putative restriction endonuclease